MPNKSNNTREKTEETNQETEETNQETEEKNQETEEANQETEETNQETIGSSTSRGQRTRGTQAEKYCWSGMTDDICHCHNILTSSLCILRDRVVDALCSTYLVSFPSGEELECSKKKEDIRYGRK